MPQLFDLKDGAAYLCVSKRTLRRLIDARRVPFFRVSKSIRVDRADLDNYLHHQRVRAR